MPARIPEIDFGHAQELIAEHTGTDPRGEPDLAPADERWLSGWALREHGSAFLFVTGYPAVKRPFYTHPDPGRPGRTRSFDLIARLTGADNIRTTTLFPRDLHRLTP